jgi:hypothetical protein
MRFFVIPFLLSVLMAAVPAQAQEDTKFLSPTEAYKAALLPLNEARAQQNDLTERISLHLVLVWAWRPVTASHFRRMYPLSQLTPKNYNDQRKAAGWALVLVGGITTIPLALGVIGKKSGEEISRAA